jgi:peptidoglycan/xylan/chitin deacetylase (PgdA/CDA1 family)
VALVLVAAFLVHDLTRGGSPAKPHAAIITNADRPPLVANPRPPARTSRELTRLIELGRPLYCGGHHGHDVALTFDDGPGPYTPLALRILRHAHAHATFFLVGRNLARWPTLPRQELTLAALGDHTWTHPNLTTLPRSEIDAELTHTQTAIAHDSGQPVRLFRPPYGRHNATVDVEARALGMLEVLWSIDSRDSEGANYRQIATITINRMRAGSIVLMHENRGQTIRALKFYLLPALRKRGLTPVSIPQLLAHDPPTTVQLQAGYGGC